MADMTINGDLSLKSQQQFFFRNSRFGSHSGGGFPGNFVSLGCEGAPSGGRSTNVQSAPVTYGKPYLVERNNVWSIVLPAKREGSVGPSADTGSPSIPMTDVFVAKEGDTSEVINAGMQGKSGLLLTPGIYKLSKPIVITADDFVVLGIGFPTLVATNSNSALLVMGSNVRVALILFEAGTRKGSPTQPLLNWKGNYGIAHDIFGRVASLQYLGCTAVQADVMMQVDGSNMFLDHTWQWHADHDDCGRKSNSCYSFSGLRVNGESAIAYGVQIEHQMGNLLDWRGEDGQLYFYQAELPYADHDIKVVGYNVDYNVKKHAAYGLGVYIIFRSITVHTAYRLPQTASVTNMLDAAWGGGASMSQFHHLVCMDAEDKHCQQGRCDGRQCSLKFLNEALGHNETVVV